MTALWWVFSRGEAIYAVRSRAEARRLAFAWHHGLVVRVSISRARHRTQAEALAALASGEVEEVGSSGSTTTKDGAR